MRVRRVPLFGEGVTKRSVPAPAGVLRSPAPVPETPGGFAPAELAGDIWQPPLSMGTLLVASGFSAALGVRFWGNPKEVYQVDPGMGRRVGLPQTSSFWVVIINFLLPVGT